MKISTTIKKDAGELGSGNDGNSALWKYPTGVESEFLKTDPLKYQTTRMILRHRFTENHDGKVSVKKPDGDVSKLIVHRS